MHIITQGKKNGALSQVSPFPMPRVTEVTKIDAKEEIASKLEEIPWQSPKRGVEYRELIKKEWLKNNTDHITNEDRKKNIRDCREQNTNLVHLGLKIPANSDSINKLKLGQTMFPLEAALPAFFRWESQKVLEQEQPILSWWYNFALQKHTCVQDRNGNTEICAWKTSWSHKGFSRKRIFETFKIPHKTLRHWQEDRLLGKPTALFPEVRACLLDPCKTTS